MLNFNINAKRLDNDLIINAFESNNNLFKITDLISFIFNKIPNSISNQISYNKIAIDNKIGLNDLIDKKIEIKINNFFKDSSKLINKNINNSYSNLNLNNFKLKVHYEDDFILVIEKPEGILIHSDGSSNITLNDLVNNFLFQNRNFGSAYHVHRLDTNTTGLILFAKDKKTCSILDYEMQNDILKRSYIACVEGILKQKEGIIELPIGRNRHVSNKYRVSKTGQTAVTLFKVLKINKEKKYSIVEVILKTGRRHQIRVHFSYIGHPIVGDEFYGAKTKFLNCKIALHSYTLQFIHPYTKNMIFIKSIPKFLKNMN